MHQWVCLNNLPDYIWYFLDHCRDLASLGCWSAHEWRRRSDVLDEGLRSGFGVVGSHDSANNSDTIQSLLGRSRLIQDSLYIREVDAANGNSPDRAA